MSVFIKADDLRAESNRHWARFNGWQTTDLTLEGVPEHLKGQIKPKLALSGKRKIFKIERPNFNVKLLAEDLARIRLFLAQEGYPHARTYPSETGDPEGRQLAVLVKIEPGPLVTVGEIIFEGWPENVPVPPVTRANLVQTGDVFRDESIRKAKDEVRIYLLEAGYASVEVSFSIEPAEGDVVDVAFSIEPGDFYIFDGLEILECPEDFEGVVRRVADFKPGLDYSDSRLTSLASDLRWTQLFQQVDLTTRTTSPGHLMVDAKLIKGRMKTLSASVGTWSDNPWMVEVRWTHRNLFKHGIGFDTLGSAATHEMNIGAGVFWLGWLSPRAKTRFGFDFETQSEDAYQSQENILELLQSFRPNNRDILQVGITASIVKVETFNADIGEAPDEQGPMLEFWTTWRLNRTDNPIFPKKGFYLKISGYVAPPIRITESPYVGAQSDLAVFRPLFKSWVVTGRLRAGIAIPLKENHDILANRRFYSGGFNTMRGYSRRGLGPQDSEGNPRGGQSTVLAGLEVRFPIWGLLEGAGFVDTGQVWREYGEFTFDEIAVAPGLALDLRTPIGPIRVNRAWNIGNQQPGAPHGMWLVGIGFPW